MISLIKLPLHERNCTAGLRIAGIRSIGLVTQTIILCSKSITPVQKQSTCNSIFNIRGRYQPAEAHCAQSMHDVPLDRLLWLGLHNLPGDNLPHENSCEKGQIVTSLLPPLRIQVIFWSCSSLLHVRALLFTASYAAWPNRIVPLQTTWWQTYVTRMRGGAYIL